MEQNWDAQREHEAAQREREAERRGEIYTTVNLLAKTMDEVRTSVRDIQTSVMQLSKDMVSREEHVKLSGQVQGLSKWVWMAMGGVALIIFLSQALPKIIELVGRP